jgi:hypothetical protein
MSKIATTIPLTMSKLWGNIPPRYYESPLYSPVQSVNNKEIITQVGAIEYNEDGLMEAQIKQLVATAEFYDEEVYDDAAYEEEEPIEVQMEEIFTSENTTIGVKRSIDEVDQNILITD